MMNNHVVLMRRLQGCTDLFAPFYCDTGGGSSTTTTQNFSPEEAAQREKVQTEASRIYGATADASQIAAYPGQQPVPFSPQTVAAQQYAQQYALGPAVEQANNINNAVSFGLSDVLYPETNPALQQTIDAAIRPIYQDYTDTGGVLSKIRDGSVAAGQFGSSRQGVAEGIASGRYANAVGDTAAKVATEGYNRGLDTFSRTLAFAPQALQTGLQPANILSGIGAQNEGQAAEMESYLNNSRMWDYNAPWMPLQNYANIIYGGSNPTTSTSSEAASNPLGTAAGIAGMLAPFFSDRRLKEEIELVGKDEATGLNLYEFNYIGTPQNRYRGVMADEVLAVQPEAVAVDAQGLMAVDYDRLGIPFEQVKGEKHV